MLGAIGLTSLGCDSNDPVKEVRKSIAAGNAAAALEPLRKLIEAEPDNPEYLFLYGRALTVTGQPGLAEWPLRKAMEDPDWYERAAMQVAASTLAGGNFDNAAALYREILEKHPDNVEAALNLANACASSPMMPEQALEEVDKILEKWPNELRAYKPRILAYLALNKPEDAQKALDDLGKRIDEIDGDESIRGWHCATNAIFAEDSGDLPLAKERWAECEKKYPAHPNVVEKSIEFHNKRGERERSLEIAQAAFAIDPSQQAGYRLLVAEQLRFQGRNDEAEQLLLDGVKEAENDEKASTAAAWLALTHHYETIGRLKAAADANERALEIAEKAYGPQPDLLFSLADLLIQINEDDRALELADRMTVPAHQTLVRARVAHKRKQYTKALDLYAETSRLWPANAYAPYHAGRAALAIGDFDRALDSFYQSIRVDENATDVRLLTARLLAEQGRWQPGLQALAGHTTKISTNAMALRVELLARFQGPAAAVKAAEMGAKRRPQAFGYLMEVGADGLARAGHRNAAWGIIKPVLSNDLEPISLTPILRAAVTYAPGDKDLALVKPYVDQLVASHPKDAGVIELEGIYFARTGDTEKAEASFQKALEAQPGRPSTLLRMAQLKAASDPEAAVALINRTMTELRFDPDLFLFAIAGLPRGPQLESLLERAVELAPMDNRMLLQLAELLDQQGGRDRRELKLAKLAVRLQGGPPAKHLVERVQARLDAAPAS
jgi:tetratricopeptide (TPR) repeat protein